jgi:hypothetical protein
MSLKERLQEWYRGKYVPPPPNDPGSPLWRISPGHYEQPSLARLLRVIAQFWLAHWQWIIGTAIAIIAIMVAA